MKNKSIVFVRDEKQTKNVIYRDTYQFSKMGIVVILCYISFIVKFES